MEQVSGETIFNNDAKTPPDGKNATDKAIFPAVEDGDSRDSGISLGDPESAEEVCPISLKTPDVKNKPQAKVLSTQSSNSSISNVFSRTNIATVVTHNVATPLCRWANKNAEDTGDKENKNPRESLEIIHFPKLTHSSSSSEESIGSRKRTGSEASATTTFERKRSRQIVVEDDTLMDEVFLPERAQSAISKSTHSLFTRTMSSDSFDDSFRTLVSTMSARAASVSYIATADQIKSPPLPKQLEVNYSLETVDRPQRESQAFRSISAKTLVDEFNRLGESVHEYYTIVDCRYPYEYEAGHVKGAINVCQKEIIKDLFFPDDRNHPVYRRIPIFYCEFSQKRGPQKAYDLRTLDRHRNEYPNVDYPEIYLLDHGYKRLFSDEAFREICEPRNYLPMNAPSHTHHLRKFRLPSTRSLASNKSSASRRTNIARKINSLFDMRNVGDVKEEEASQDSFTISRTVSAADLFYSESREDNVTVVSTPNDTSEADIDSALQQASEPATSSVQQAFFEDSFLQFSSPPSSSMRFSLASQDGLVGSPIPSLLRRRLDFSSISSSEDDRSILVRDSNRNAKTSESEAQRT